MLSWALVMGSVSFAVDTTTVFFLAPFENPVLPRSKGVYDWHLPLGNPGDLEHAAAFVWVMLSYCVLGEERTPAGIKG